MLNVIMLNVIMLNAIMLNVIMLNVIMLSVTAPLLGSLLIQSENRLECLSMLSLFGFFLNFQIIVELGWKSFRKLMRNILCSLHSMGKNRRYNAEAYHCGADQ
jgi:hypothetical protein